MSDINRCCDLILKGGITSGVLYPTAIQEISRKFHFIGIGGTSAGGIASCATAAAEYRRRETGSDDGFKLLERVSKELSKPNRLLSLFQPDRETRDIFEFAIKVLEGKVGIARIGTYLLWRREQKFRTIVNNGYGLCTGMANGNAGSAPALTPWLADLIDEIAGKQDGTPLTFRDLHNAKIPESLAALMKGCKRSIDLRSVTTSLTFRRPFEIPFSTKILAFDPDEWSKLFPARIIDFLKEKAAGIDANELRQDGKLPLPTDDLPVIVAARMSLSFPFLFTMVPLWSVNYHLEKKPLQKNWFSDGGITSNFPIHLFDALYPRWPTLGINLQSTDESGLPQRRRLRTTEKGNMVYLTSTRSGGVLDLYDAFDSGSGAQKQLLGFASAVFRSSQNWHDNSFLKLPGYRDRVAEIWLTKKEGGLNLNMDPETIKGLVDRGRQAGKEIAFRFADLAATDSMSWQGHRWARFRSSMTGLMSSLQGLQRSAQLPSPGSVNLLDLFASPDAPPNYKFGTGADDQREAAKRITEALLRLAAEIETESMHGCSGEDAGPFCHGPHPAPTLGGRAPL